ncbi:MAG TPA: ADP-ribosylglycohydrolase family protein [Longimicrobiales bacterium]|nr:ADP-ribosylglycohydrolase family protein [Longimicrobiales bacterium]
MSRRRGSDMRDRVRGGLIGLAAGDALGTALEFKPPGTFEPITDMVGGGPFRLAAGMWTDDTSMALCLAESLIERRGFDALDQMQRYIRWRDDGHLSSNGWCFDIGTTVNRALRRFEETGDPFAGDTDRDVAGNGSLMRLAPVPLYFRDDPQVAHWCAESSRTTHASSITMDACRYMGALIAAAVNGAPKEGLLGEDFWQGDALDAAIEPIARGSFKAKQPPDIRGTGYAADALEAALWAFHSSDDFRTGALLAVNLGDDADTTGAIYGQLAGAYYGESEIPAEWREWLALRELVEGMAEQLAGRASAMDFW